MVKNLFLLGLLTWVSLSHAKPVVVKESMAQAESYKVEKSVPEEKAERSVAGSRIKKKRAVKEDGAGKTEPMSESDSEVRYWQYQE